MSYPSLAFTCAVMLLLAGAACTADKPEGAARGGTRQNEETQDRKVQAEEIKGLITKYAQSIDDANATLASEIWSNTADVSFVHPRGHEHGWEAIRTNVYENTMRDLFSERKLKVHSVVVHVYQDAAWAEFYWDFMAKFRKGGATLRTEGRETQVYRKNDRRWFLVHVHYSGMPVTGERRGF